MCGQPQNQQFEYDTERQTHSLQVSPVLLLLLRYESEEVWKDLMRSVALSTKGVESEKDLSNDSIQKCATIQKITLTYDYLGLLQIDS